MEEARMNWEYDFIVFDIEKGPKIIQEVLNDEKNFIKAWQINERHYGALTGLNKDEMKKKLGEEKVHQFRRSWDLRPEPLDKKNPYHPLNIETYKDQLANRLAPSLSIMQGFTSQIKKNNLEIKNLFSKIGIFVLS